MLLVLEARVLGARNGSGAMGHGRIDVCVTSALPRNPNVLH